MTWLRPGKPPVQKVLIRQLLNQSVEIWWPEDKKFYKGTVVRYIPDKVRHEFAFRSTLFCQSLPIAQEDFFLDAKGVRFAFTAGLKQLQPISSYQRLQEHMGILSKLI